MKQIQFDGAAIPNPGKRGIGAILLDNGNVIHEISEKLEGIGTNNEAEYNALIQGLKKAHDLGWTDINVQGDSKLVVNQVNGKWSVKSDNLKVPCQVAKELVAQFNSIKLEWIPREQNEKADYAASKALGFPEDPYHKKYTKKTLNKGNRYKNNSDFSKNNLPEKCYKCEDISKCKLVEQGFENICKK